MDALLLIKLAFVGATVIIALLLIVALLSIKKGNKKANLFLVFIIFINAIGCITSLLMYTGAYKQLPTPVLATYPFVFIIGAVYYFYIKLLLNKNYRFKWYYLLHAIPLFWGINEVKWFFPFSFDKKVHVLTQMWFGGYKIGFNEFIMYSIPNFITTIYLIACLILISKTIQKLKTEFSNTDIEYVTWLKKFTIVYLTLILLDITRLGLTVPFGWDPGQGEIITNLLISILIQYYIFQVIKNPERVFYSFSLPNNIPQKVKNNTLIAPKKIIKVAPIFADKLTTFMIAEKPYLNPELKSHELATMLDVTPHYLSKIINQEFHVNFYNFINQYRVEEFKKTVLENDNRNLTLTAIAQNVGFNSKSSFNRIFKSLTQITPTEYIKQNSSNQSA